MIRLQLREKLKSKVSKQKVKSKNLYCNFCGISKVHIRKGIWVVPTDMINMTGKASPVPPGPSTPMTTLSGYTKGIITSESHQ